MTTPDLDAAFADLEARYPGSRHSRRPLTVSAATARELVAWDGRPYSKLIGGKPVELFAIGALATALDRPLVTIRLWTRNGHLPQATYRLPSRRVPVFGTEGVPVSYREQAGRRLYTRAQIEAVITAAVNHGILHAPRVDWSQHPRFALDIADAWQQLSI